MPALSSQNVVSVVTEGAATTHTKQVVVDGAASVIVVVNISARTGGTLTVTVSGLSASGAKWTLLASAGLTSVATTTLTISPDITASANAIAQAVVPSCIQIDAVSSSTPSGLSYTVDVECGY